jgi:CBS domain containing-hemolysin-like protein
MSLSRILRSTLAPLCALAATLAAVPAHASFLSGDALDTMANVIAIIVLIVVPVVAVVVFWLVHVLPETIAEKRHHPQAAAIQTLCLLSLAFGGLLWPLAWLWAFTKPIGYRIAYGTDKAESWHEEMGDKARAGTLLREDLAHLRAELESMDARGALNPKLKQLKAELDSLKAQAAANDPPAGGKA